MMQMQVNKQQAKAIQDEFAKVPAQVSSAAKRVATNMGFRYAMEVKKEYRTGPKSGIPLAQGTLLKRAQGKRGTKYNRAIPAYGGSTPLMRTGTLASSIIVKTRQRGKISRTIIRVNPRTILPGGGIAWKVANVQEFGMIINTTAPVWARAYLFALYMGKAGTNEKIWISPGEKTIQIIIPPRPVWRPVIMRMMQRQPREFATLFHKEFQRRTKFNVVVK